MIPHIHQYTILTLMNLYQIQNKRLEFFLSHCAIDSSEARQPAAQIESEIKLRDIFVTEQEVRDLINILDTSKSTGCDEISPKLVCKAGDSIVSPLTRLFDLCLHKNQNSQSLEKSYCYTYL